jgi:uncharacterized protein YndB with AHSA1/START domain
MAPLIIKKSILVNAPASKLWKVLTKPDLTKKYMFGSEVHSDWEIGSSIEWKGIIDNKETVLVKGKIIEIDPEKHLVYSTFDPQGGLPDIPENYLSVTYNISSQNNQTQLTVIQGDFSTVAEGPDRFDDAVKGWEATLPEIKTVAETEQEC